MIYSTYYERSYWFNFRKHFISVKKTCTLALKLFWNFTYVTAHEFTLSSSESVKWHIKSLSDQLNLSENKTKMCAIMMLLVIWSNLSVLNKICYSFSSCIRPKKKELQLFLRSRSLGIRLEEDFSQKYFLYL